jgi:hypothetical protein
MDTQSNHQLYHGYPLPELYGLQNIKQIWQTSQVSHKKFSKESIDNAILTYAPGPTFI